MSVRKRGNSWIIDLKVGPERVRRHIRGSKQDAIRAEAQERARLMSERAPERGLEDGLYKYLTEHVPRLKDSRGQRSKAAKIRPFIEGKTFADVRDVAAEIKSADLAPATINRRLAILRRICSLAYKEWGWLDKPISISLLPEQNQRHIYLSKGDVMKIASHCSEGASDAIRLAAYTGMRRSELFRARKDGGFFVLDANTKSGRPRVVPVHPDIADIELPLKTTDAILRKEWERARVEAGMGHVRFHDLRHTWASWLAQAGVPLYTIGEILGHSQAQTTKRYSHLGRDDLASAVRRVK